jgi:Tfp pilus assembly protein PilN
MFTIDLLKGQGISIKTTPQGIAVTAVTTVVPATVAVIMCAMFLHSRVLLSVQNRQIDQYKTKTAALTDAVQQKRISESEKTLHANCLSELNLFISKYSQWSPILATLTDSLPESLVLTAMEINETSVKRKVPKKDDPQIVVETTVPVKTLKLTVCGSPDADNNNAVKELRENLRNSDLLGPKLENITVSQETNTLEGKNVASYNIDCVFKLRL